MIEREMAKKDNAGERIDVVLQLIGRKNSAIEQHNNEIRYSAQPFGAYADATTAGAFNSTYPGA